MPKTNNALKIIDQMIGTDSELRELVEQAAINAQVAQLIYDARMNANLTQAELAKLLGISQSIIADLENADYEGHSLRMLQRIASVLNKRLQISFVPVNKNLQPV